MKRVILGLAVLLVAACGTSQVAVNNTPTKAATPSPQVTKAEKAYLGFSADSKESIVVYLNGKEYRTQTIRMKDLGGTQTLKSISNDILTLDPGTYEVVVKDLKGAQLYQGKVRVKDQDRAMLYITF